MSLKILFFAHLLTGSLALRMGLQGKRVHTISMKKPAERAGIAFITTTGKEDIEKAVKMQIALAQHLEPPDVALHVCDPECREDKRLKSLIIMPSSLTANLVNPDPNKQGNGYLRAQVKYLYGIISMQRELVDRGAAVWPEWYLIKDSDTYVNMNNLKRDLSSRNSSDLLMLGSKQGPWNLMGGGGVAISWSLAEKVFLEHGDDMLKDFLSKPIVPYDEVLPLMVSKLEPSFTFEDDPNFNHFGPNGNPKDHCGSRFKEGSWYSKDYKSGKTKCFDTPACACARSPYPATFHLNPFSDGELKRAQRADTSSTTAP